MLAVALKIILAGAVAGTIDIINKNKKDVDFSDKWDTIMVNCGVKSKGDEGSSYKVLKAIKRGYGTDLIVAIPDGLTYTGLEALQEQLKISFRCHELHMEYKRQSGTAYIKLVTNPMSDDTIFQPVKIKPWEIYLGTTKYFKDIIVDMRKFPHILIAGTTGAGKSLYTVQTVLNMIVNFDEKEVNLYFSEISDKDDFKQFRSCKIVKGYARNLGETAKMLKHLYDTMGIRNKMFNEFDDINNIADYNEKFPYKTLPYIYFVSDEYHLFMEDDSDTDEEDFLKKQCQALMKKLAKLARNAGIFIVSSLQRPDRESMPAIFKTNLNVIVAFKQRNGASALTVLDSYKPMELRYREAIVDYGGDQFIIYSLFINNFIIKSYLDNKKEDNHEYVDLSSHEWLIKLAKKHKKGKKGNKGKKNDSELMSVEDLETASTSTTSANNLNNVVNINEANSNGKKKNNKGAIE